MINAAGDGQEARPAIEILSLVAREVLCRCLFPFTRPIYQLSLIPNHNFKFSPTLFTLKAEEFLPDPDLNIIAISMDFEAIEETDDAEDSGTMILMVKSLLNVCASMALGSPGNVIDWEVWGPQSTRWLPPPLVSAGDFSVFGSRIVVWDQGIYVDLAILDFNPRNLQGMRLPHGIDDVLVFDHPSEVTYNVKGSGLTHIKSCLPFRKLILGKSTYRLVNLNGMSIMARQASIPYFGGSNDI